MSEIYQKITLSRLVELIQNGMQIMDHYEIIESSGLFYLSDLLPDHINQITFSNCIFNVICDFSSNKLYTLTIRDCIFKKEVSMQREMDNLYIYDCEFEDNFFILTKVARFTVIKNTTFHRIFQYSPYDMNSQDIRFLNCKFLAMGFFRRLIMNKNFIFNQCNLVNCSFLYSSFEDAVFADCSFDLNHQLSLDERIYFNKNNILNDDFFKENAREDFHKISLKNIISSYKEFEKNFDKARNYEDAGNFHKRAFELERERKKGLSKFILWLYKKSSSYGEEYTTSLKWMMILLIFFSFVYMISGVIYTYGNESCVVYYCKPANRYNVIQDIGIGFVYSFNSSITIRKGLDFVESGSPITSVL